MLSVIGWFAPELSAFGANPAANFSNAKLSVPVARCCCFVSARLAEAPATHPARLQHPVTSGQCTHWQLSSDRCAALAPVPFSVGRRPCSNAFRSCDAGREHRQCDLGRRAWGCRPASSLDGKLAIAPSTELAGLGEVTDVGGRQVV